MPQAVYDRLVKQYGGYGTVEYFLHATDTTNGRNAGYMAFVVKETGVYYGRTGYGKIGTNYRENTLGAFASFDDAKQEVTKVFNGKLKKNYKDDTYLVTQSTPALPKSSPSNDVENPFGFPLQIPLYSSHLPDNVEIEQSEVSITDEKTVLEWYPNRMRFKIYGLYRTGIGIYNISGRLESSMHYPYGYDCGLNAYIEMTYYGQMFLGYEDINGHIVLLRYIAEVGNLRKTEVTTYAVQRNIMEMIMDTLTAYSNVDPMSPDSEIYVNPRITSSEEKEAALLDRKPLNRYANNLAVFKPDKDMSVLDFVER